MLRVLSCGTARVQAELIAARQTPEEKRALLAQRAKGLWEAREAQRQATANALLERHFRCAFTADISAAGVHLCHRLSLIHI